MEEVDAAQTQPYDLFRQAYPDRTFDAWRLKRQRSAPNTPVNFVDKREGSFDWRKANQHIAGMQELSEGAKSSQDTAHIVIDSDEPIGIIFISDAHIGDWSTDDDLF